MFQEAMTSQDSFLKTSDSLKDIADEVTAKQIEFTEKEVENFDGFGQKSEGDDRL